MDRYNRAIALILVTGFISLDAVVRATVLVPAEFREIVRGSDLIAYARVVETRPEWAEGRRRIDTIVTVEIVTWLKGGTDSTIEFKVPGGELGRYRDVMVGAPVFARGDEAFLFLNSRGDAMPYVFGLNQGVFRVRVDPRTGQRVVVAPALMAPAGASEPVTRGDVARQPVVLEAFGARVRSVIAETGAGR